jgi:hypothetical protein
MTKRRLIIAILAYFVLLAGYGFAVYRVSSTPAAAGQFGDMFGGFTAALNGLALFGVAYTIYLQNSAHVVTTLDIFHRRWNEEPMLRTRLRTCQRILDCNDNKFSQSMQHVAEFFEHMGTLVKLQAIDSKVIWQLYSWYIESYWTMFEQMIMEVRRQNRDKTAYSEFEWLYRQMEVISRNAGVPSFEKTTKEISEFARSDKKLAERLLALNGGNVNLFKGNENDNHE